MSKHEYAGELPFWYDGKSVKCFALFSPAALQNGHRDFWKW